MTSPAAPERPPDRLGEGRMSDIGNAGRCHRPLTLRSHAVPGGPRRLTTSAAAARCERGRAVRRRHLAASAFTSCIDTCDDELEAACWMALKCGVRGNRR